jgi:alanine racemase
VAQGLKYAASTIVMLGKKQDKEGTDLVGNIIKAKMFKSRLSKEGKIVEVKLSFEKGLHRYYGLLDLAEKYDLVKKVSTRYEMPDGTKVYAKSVYADPEKYFTKDFMAKLDEAAKKEYMYGVIEEDEEFISDSDAAREDELTSSED